MSELVIGLDVGTTAIKAVCYDAELIAVDHAQVSTVWDTDEFGGTRLRLPALAASVHHLIESLTANAASAGGHADAAVIRAIGITGMAETGVLLDEANEPIWPAIAWHDPRGGNEASALRASDPVFARNFGYVTGLPLDAQASFSKLLWLSARLPGARRGRQWLSIPEYVAWLLTGRFGAERSLLSSTGLYDHTGERLWDDSFERIGLSPDVIPNLIDSGTTWGPAVRGPATGAAITVAGHHRVVAALGAGVDAPDQLFNSCGTADVVVRIITRWPDPDAFALLAPLDISLGNHTAPGQFVVNVRTKAGLALQRLTQLFGPIPAHARPAASGGLVDVNLPEPGSDELGLTLRGPVTTELVWSQALHVIADQGRTGLALMEHVFGPYTEAVCGGGWTNVEPVCQLKRQIYRDVRFSTVRELACRGAALAAMAAADRSAPEAATRSATEADAPPFC